MWFLILKISEVCMIDSVLLLGLALHGQHSRVQRLCGLRAWSLEEIPPEIHRNFDQGKQWDARCQQLLAAPMRCQTREHRCSIQGHAMCVCVCPT